MSGKPKAVGVLIFTVFFVLIIILLRWFFAKVLFRPSRKHIWRPDGSFTDIMIDGVHMCHINNIPDRPTMIHCHGQSNNISELRNTVSLAARMRVNIILFDYFGYGFSKRNPSQEGLFESSDIVMKYAMKHARPPFIIWGESLGGAVAVRLASKYNVSHLVLLATFSSLDDIPRTSNRSALVKIMGRAMPYLVNTLESYKLISRVTCPVTIVHSKEDNLISFVHAEKLLENITHEDKKLIPVKGIHPAPQMTQNELNILYKRCGLGDIAPDCNDILHKIARWAPICDAEFHTP